MQARNGIIHLACTFYLFSEVYRNHHFNVTLEGVSKLSFQCGSRDAIQHVSTTGLTNYLILSIL